MRNLILFSVAVFIVTFSWMTASQASVIPHTAKTVSASASHATMIPQQDYSRGRRAGRHDAEESCTESDVSGASPSFQDGYSAGFGAAYDRFCT